MHTGGANWLFSEWTWTSIGLTFGLTLIYRYAMSSRPVAWVRSGASPRCWWPVIPIRVIRRPA